MDVSDNGNEAVPRAEFSDNVLQVRRVFHSWGGDTHDLAAHRNQLESLLDTFDGTHRIAGQHRLHDHRMGAANNDPAARWIPRLPHESCAVRNGTE
jgi:hypothetical protein